MGSIYDKGAATVFCIPRHRSMPQREMMELAGLTNIQPDSFQPDGKAWYGRWVSMYCQPDFEAIGMYDVLILRVYQSDLLSRIPDSEQEPDKLLTFAEAFAGACDALRPDIAFTVSGAAQSRCEWMRKYYAPPVLQQDANALVEKHFGLLYMNAELASKWKQYESYQNFRSWSDGPVFEFGLRDGLNATPDGMYLFAGTGRGRSRWL